MTQELPGHHQWKKKKYKKGLGTVWESSACQTKGTWVGFASWRRGRLFPASQVQTTVSCVTDQGRLTCPPSLLWQHKSETCTVPPNSKALPPGRARGQSPFYVTQIALPHAPLPQLHREWLGHKGPRSHIWEDEWMLKTIGEVLVRAPCHQF